MDALFADAIENARYRGLDAFDFSASPPDQLGLVRYKEKWGGRTEEHTTLTLAASRATGVLLRSIDYLSALERPWRFLAKR